MIYDVYIIYYIYTYIYIYTLRFPSETSSSLSSKEMGMCATPALLRVIEVSNCAAMRCTSTIADITGGITAVDRCSSCVAQSFS